METINEVRSLLDNAFKQSVVAVRNKKILKASKALNELDKLNNESVLIKNIRESYSRELLERLQPTSINDDIMSYIALKSLNPEYESILKLFPSLEVKYQRFMESLRKDQDFEPFLRSLKQAYE